MDTETMNRPIPDLQALILALLDWRIALVRRHNLSLQEQATLSDVVHADVERGYLDAVRRSR